MYKTCFKCKQKKEISEFYKHREMKDGHLNKCKGTQKKRNNRRAYINRSPEYAQEVYIKRQMKLCSESNQ